MKDELTKHTMFLRKGDYARLKDIYASRGIPTAVVIRKLVSKFVDGLEVPTNAEQLATLPDLLHEE